MRILLAHNRYRQGGGEDNVFEAESALLRRNGHSVIEFVKDNRAIDGSGGLRLAANAIWSRKSYLEVAALVANHRPDIIHFHNTLPLISPAPYFAARRKGIPVIQTLHNFRLVCPNSILFRNGAVCTDCLQKTIPWPGVLHSCYRGSRAASATVAASLVFHRARRTWSSGVTRYIALTEFAKRIFVDNGIPSYQIKVKPNFVEDLGHRDPLPRRGALYVGRLSPEKGPGILLQAWKNLSLPLTVIGDGPMFASLAKSCPPSMKILGSKSPNEVAAAMHRASFLVMPSLCFEGFALVLAEAFSHALPVIASRLGAMQEIVEHKHTGLLFAPGDSADLARQVRWAQERPALMRRMGENARRRYEHKYTPEANYELLRSIYDEAKFQEPNPPSAQSLSRRNRIRWQ